VGTELTPVVKQAQPADLPAMMQLANHLAKSGYFQDARDASQAVVKVMAGAELGIPPIAAMTGIFIVKGRVTLSANLMAAAIRRSGRYGYRVVTLTDAACEIEFTHDGKPIGRSSFTEKDAAKAGLTGGDNWRKYPRNMLYARAMSNGAKWYCPDVFCGPVYSPDEIEDEPEAPRQPVRVEAVDPAPQQQAQPAPTPAASGPSISRDQWEEIKSRLAAAEHPQRAFLDRFGVSKPGELPASRFGEMRDFLNTLGEPRQPEPEPAVTPLSPEQLAAKTGGTWPPGRTLATREQLDRIATEAVRTGTPPEVMLSFFTEYGVSRLEDLSAEQASELLERFGEWETMPPEVKAAPVEDQGGAQEEVEDLIGDIDGLCDPLNADGLRDKINAARKRIGAPCADDLLGKVDEKLRLIQNPKKVTSGKRK
jgi:hypothetical protein